MADPSKQRSARMRAQRISAHLVPAATKGEEQHPISEQSLSRQSLFRFRYQRQVVKIVVKEEGSGGTVDKYGGIPNVFVLEGELLIPNASSGERKTVLVFMHPAATMNMLPMPVALARAGCHVMLCGSRYAGNDTCLIMEKCVKDLASYITYCRETLGFERIVLCGWSGGGSLSVFYQSQATIEPAKRVTSPIDLTDAQLPAADSLIVLAAHASRARLLTESLDPSIWMFRSTEISPETSLGSLSLYADGAPSPPYSEAFVQKYRAAQHARSKRIDAWAREQLAAGCPDAPCVIDGTMADPRWLDPTIDPNDRAPGSCFLGTPSVANNMSTGLARFCTAVSWLSQWSGAESNADAVAHIGNVKVPVLIVENGADNGCPATHPREVLEACTCNDRQYYCVRGASHYYDGQPEKLLESCQVVLQWLIERSMVDVSLKHSSVVQPQQLQQLRSCYDGSSAMEISSVNHLALVSSDMDRTCDFYGRVLGLRLCKTIALPGGGQHFFFSLPDGNALAFFWFKDAHGAMPGVSAPSLQQMLKTGQHPSAHGSMNHVAFNVPEAKLKEYRSRIKAANVGFVSPILFHADTAEGYVGDRNHDAVSWVSFYFFGPDGELLELTSQTKSFEDAESNVVHMPRKALWRELSANGD